MKNQQKTKAELIAELSKLRQTVAQLQNRQALQKAKAIDPTQQIPSPLPEEIQFRTTLENIKLIAVTLNADGQIVFCNEFLLTLTGWTREELLGRDWFQTFIPSDPQQTLKHDIFLKTIRTGDFPIQLKNKIVTRQGEHRLIAWHNTIHCNPQGQVAGVTSLGDDITDRIQTEEALRQSEQRYKRLYHMFRLMADNVPDLIWAKDMKKRFIFTNKAICEKLLNATDTEEPVGKTDTFFANRERKAHPENPAWHTIDEICTASDEVVMESKQSQRVEAYGNVKGKFLFLDVHKAPFWDEQGDMIGTVGTGRDVTKLKQAEQTLRLYTQRLQTMHEIDQAILAARSPQDIAAAALSRLRQIIPCRRASVAEYFANGKKYFVLALAVDYKTTLNAGQTFDSSPDTLAELQRGQVYRVKNIFEHKPVTPFRQKLITEGIKSFVAIPLRVQEKLIGALHLGADTLDAFSDDQIEIAGGVADSLAVAIAQANLHAQTLKDAETKETLLREVNHRVHNNLATIISLLNIEQDRAIVDSPEAYRAKIAELTNRVRGLASVHRLLSETMWAPLLLHELAEKIIKTGIDSLSPRKYIATTIPPASVRVSAQSGNALALILNELVTNSVKHGWPNREYGQITITISQHNTHIALQYRDDGRGYSDQMLQEHRYNLGLRLVKSLVSHGLQGKLTLFNDNGAGALIQFSLKEDQP